MTELPRRADERLLPPAAAGTSEVGWWGMVLFCATEAMLFAYLIASYFYLGVSSPNWPPSGFEKPTLPLPLVMTAFLLTGSITIRWGEKNLEDDVHGRFRAGLAATILLGICFLGIQAVEYHDKLTRMSPMEHAYGAIFFAITGFHGTHVAFGVLFLTYVAVRELLGHFTARDHLAVTNASLYWHTVDGVWIAILASLYLSPRFY